MESANSFAVSDFAALTTAKREGEDKMSDLSVNEQRGNHHLTNRRSRGATMDQKLDKDEIDQDLLHRNITEMIKAGMPIVSFPES